MFKIVHAMYLKQNNCSLGSDTTEKKEVQEDKIISCSSYYKCSAWKMNWLIYRMMIYMKKKEIL